MRFNALCRRSAFFCCELFAVTTVALVLIAGIAMWRLAVEPVSMNYFRPYIENTLSRQATGYSTDIGQVWLKWDAFEGPPVLQVEAMDVFKSDNHLVHIGKSEIAFSPWPLIYGAFRPVRITAAGPEIRVVRTSDGAFRFDIADARTGANDSEDGNIDGPLPDTDFATRLADLLSNEAESGTQSVFSQLERLEMRNGAVRIADHKKGMTWHIPSVNLAANRHDKGLVVTGDAALVSERTSPRLHLESLYTIGTGTLEGQLEFEKLSPALIARFLPDRKKMLRAQTMHLDGHIDFSASQDLAPETLQLTASLSDGTAKLALPGIYESAVPISDLDLKLALDRDKQTFAIDRLALSYARLPIELRASGNYSYEDNSLTATAPVQFASSAMPVNDIAGIWPKMARDDPAYEWFGKKLESGRLKNIGASADVKLRLDEDGEADKPVIQADTIKASGNFEDMHVNYRPPLIPGKGVHGGFEFADNTLEIAIEGGDIGDMAVKSGSVKSTKVLNDGEGQAFIDLSLAGPLQMVMTYIQRKPIEAEDLLDVPRDELAGEAELDVSLQFPTLPDVPIEKINTKVEGTLRDVVLPRMVNDLDVTGGPITVKGESGQLDMSGDAKLAGRDVSFEWTRYLDDKGGEPPYLSRIEASLTSDAGLRQAFDLRLEEHISGALPLELDITEHERGKLDIDLEGDLTPAQLSIDALDYRKPKGKKGHINANLSVRDESLRQVEDLDMQAPNLRVADAQLAFTPTQTAPRLTSGAIKRLAVDATDTGVEISRNDNDRLVLDLKGDSLDARPFLGPAKRQETRRPGPRTPVIIKGDVARVQTTENRGIRDVELYIDVPGQGFVDQLEMNATAGDKPIYLRYKPDDKTKRQKLVLDAGNAGAFMRAFDIYENMRGGALKVRAHAKNPESEDVLKGELTIRDFQVVDAPVLAKLLNALSLSGVQELLQDDGISFTRLQSDMHYITKDDKRMIRFRDGRTSGSALGLTFEGKVDQANETLAINGTIVPASNVNRFLSRVPVIGRVLAGDKGDGVFAATYRIDGDATETTITINPLSVLAPGILRKMFFE